MAAVAITILDGFAWNERLGLREQDAGQVRMVGVNTRVQDRDQDARVALVPVRVQRVDAVHRVRPGPLFAHLIHRLEFVGVEEDRMLFATGDADADVRIHTDGGVDAAVVRGTHRVNLVG